MSPERATLRRLVDQAVRERVAAENAKLDLCAGCDMPRSDWTPGCKTCWNRWRNYQRLRTRCPYPVDPSFYARMRMIAERWEVVAQRAKAERMNDVVWGRAA